MMVLAISRRLPQLLELQRERTWQPLAGARDGDVTVGVVGLGSIGRRVAELALTFGARVVATRAQGRATDRADRQRSGSPVLARAPAGAAGQSDFVVLALPLTSEHGGPVRRRPARPMPSPGAWLINVARGALVDERALVRAVRDGPLGGAVLDAFRDEPLPPNSPLYATPNIIVTPHTSWSSGACSTAASSCSATTWAASGAVSRCSTWSIRGPATDRTANLLGVQVAIVGLARSGKTTVFNTLTRGHAETGGFGGMTVNVGRGQGARRAADQADRAVQAQAGGAGRRDLRRPARAATVGRRSRARPRSRPISWRGCATPMSCSTSCARSRTRRCPTPTARVDPWRDIERLDLEFVLADLARGREAHREAATSRATTARPRSARRTSASWPCWSSSLPGAARGPPIRDVELDDDEAQAHPRLPLPDREAGPGPAQHRRGRHRQARPTWWPSIAERYAHKHVRRRSAVGAHRDGDRPARRGGGGQSSAPTWA